MSRPLSSFLAVAATLLVPTLAFAQGSAGAGAPAASDPKDPSALTKGSSASTGSNDVAKGGFVTSEAQKEEDAKHINDVSLGLGGLFSAGNARQIALTALAKGRFRREEHQFTFASTFNYARAGKKDEAFETTVQNVQGLLRYDHFVSNNLSFFGQATGRNDKFQGLDLRLNLDPGVAYYFINDKTHRLWGELGYDLQHDIRRDDALVQPVPADAPPGTLPITVDKTKTLHNSRLFVGYENKLRKEVALVASVEYIQNFGTASTYRVIGDIGLKSNVADNLALATTYTARYENNPLPGVQRLDSIASINLVYSFF